MERTGVGCRDVRRSPPVPFFRCAGDVDVPRLHFDSSYRTPNGGNNLDIKDIKQIVDLMKRSDLTEFEIEEEGLKLRICRSGGVVVENRAPSPVAAAVPPAAVESATTAAPAEASGKVIKSPMVGTFYSAPSPDSPPFVKSGDEVTEDSTVCIIEAMKVMNEIKAEISGKIAEVLVKNGESVEFGQPLFRVKA
ncbi:MAG: acetyl-CoA carboxylase biotin carboxyl carrier protein [Opitutales bacterium]|nr:acetyl-CoA carboxylase biotin carboxyl carrier protein [Opitutales bacterium]